MRNVLILLFFHSCILVTQTSAQSASKWKKIVPLPGGFGNGLFINRIESVSAVDDSICFICPTVGTRPFVNGQPSLLMKTTNGGRTWDSVPFPNKAKPSKVHFVNKDTGFASVSWDGRLWKTTNSGDTWTEIEISPNFSNILTWYAIDGNTVFVAGNDDKDNGFHSGNSLFARTTDGGNSWNLTQLKGIGVISMSFLNKDIGVLSCPRGYFASTQDGGLTFEIKQLFKDEFMYGVHVFDSSQVIIGGQNGGLFISNDFCKNWGQVTSPAQIYHLNQIHNSTLFIGSWGKFYFSNDAGNTWYADTIANTLFSGGKSLVRSSSFLSNGTGWVVGWDTVLLKREPGIKTTLSKTNLCINDTFSVTINIDNFVKVDDRNLLIVELSDSLGKFSNPTILATYASKPKNEVIVCQLLESNRNLPGHKYKIRARLGTTIIQVIDNISLFRKPKSVFTGPVFSNRGIEQIYSVENLNGEFYRWSCTGVAKIIGRDDNTSVRIKSELDGQAELSLTIRNMGNCTITQSKTIYFKGIVNINENIYDNLGINIDVNTPTTSGDNFRIKNAGNSTKQRVSLINILGNMEYDYGEFFNEYEESTYRIPNLQPGLYFIVIKSSNDFVYKRIVVSD
jgi:photosystem II stability/assembly factor-like uncharacterized protein